MSAALDDYFDALNRLRKGQTTVVPKGTPISLDSVALEAGRKKGAIRSSRPIFRELVTAIRQAASEKNQNQNDMKSKLAAAKLKAENYRGLYEEALARELNLAYEVLKLRSDRKKHK